MGTLKYSFRKRTTQTTRARLEHPTAPEETLYICGRGQMQGNLVSVPEAGLGYKKERLRDGQMGALIITPMWSRHARGGVCLLTWFISSGVVAMLCACGSGVV